MSIYVDICRNIDRQMHACVRSVHAFIAFMHVQDDVVFAALTVREALLFAARHM